MSSLSPRYFLSLLERHEWAKWGLRRGSLLGQTYPRVVSLATHAVRSGSTVRTHDPCQTPVQAISL
jgi:hypothetical protein